MEKKSFYSLVETKSRQLEKREKQERKQHVREQLELRAREKHAAPFKESIQRHEALLAKVRTLVSGGAKWDVMGSGYYQNEVVAHKQGIPVVLGDSPQTKATPDHTAVCVISVRSSNNYYHDRKEDRVSYDFAHIPNTHLSSFISATGWPLGTVDKSPKAIIEREVSATTNELEQYADSVNYVDGIRNWLKAKTQLRELNEAVEKVEQTLQWVSSAAANHKLNPHLSELVIPQA